VRRGRPVVARKPGRWRRRAAWLLALLLALLALLWVWSVLMAEPEVPPPPEVKVEGKGEKPKDTRPPIALPKPPVVKPPSGWSPDRALLRAAILSRASDLRTCALPPGAPTRLLTKLRVVKAGPVRSVAFANAEPIPRSLSECLRTKMMAWNFADVKLGGDVEAMVTFNLGAQ
jgi:hypothetical protein